MVNIDVSTMIKIEHQISGYINGISNTPMLWKIFLNAWLHLKTDPTYVTGLLCGSYMLSTYDSWCAPKRKGGGSTSGTPGTHCFCDFTISIPRHPSSNQV